MAVVISALVFGWFLESCNTQAICPSCDVSQNLTKVRVPTAMPLDDFEKHILNKQWSELYYAYRFKDIFDPYYNYKISLSGLTNPADDVQEYVEADELGRNFAVTPKCIQVFNTLKLTPLQDGETELTARFELQGAQQTRYYWSSCPDKYFWVLKCSGGDRTHCPVGGVQLGLAVPYKGPITSLENLPWSSMLSDLRTSTRIVLGTDDWYWAWTFGDSQYCNN